LTGNRFPFHTDPAPRADRVAAQIGNGKFNPPQHAVLAVEENGRFVGVVILDDLDGDAPMIDVRLAEVDRGRGLGTRLIEVLANQVFETHPEASRIEAQTRDDNVAMRRALIRNGWVKEAHFRRTWPVHGGSPRDSVSYGLLRTDHDSGRSTPVPWDDMTPG
jgi:RimJ/RimL family protein N-acetyltransferase